MTCGRPCQSGDIRVKKVNTLAENNIFLSPGQFLLYSFSIYSQNTQWFQICYLRCRGKREGSGGVRAEGAIAIFKCFILVFKRKDASRMRGEGGTGKGCSGRTGWRAAQWGECF